MLDTTNIHILSYCRYHTIKTGSATIPYKAVASRTKSKSKNNQLSANKIHKYLEYLEDTMLSPDFSDSEEFVDFLNSLTEEVPNVSITPSKEVSTSSTCSSSGFHLYIPHLIHLIQLFLELLLPAHLDTLLWRGPPLILRKRILEFQSKMIHYQSLKFNTFLDLHVRLTTILHQWSLCQASQS